jgi:hypothetical protein
VNITRAPTRNSEPLGRDGFAKPRGRAWGRYTDWRQASCEKRKIIRGVASDFSGINRLRLIYEDADRSENLDDVSHFAHEKAGT